MLNLYKVICQLYLNKLEKRKKKWPVCVIHAVKGFGIVNKAKVDVISTQK